MEDGIKERYRRRSLREKRGILAESTRVTGHHSKTSIKLSNRKPKRVSEQWSGLALSYGHEVTGFSNVAWDVTDRLCARRLQPFSYLSW